MIILGVAYSFVTNKNKVTSVKVGNNIFNVEVAETAGQQAKGLSYRDSLDEGAGMYFRFERDDTYGFWMMGMRFPIDIIWIKNNKVIGMEKNISAPTPGTPGNALTIYKPPEAITEALEVNAGLCDKLGINIGDEVDFNNYGTR